MEGLMVDLMFDIKDYANNKLIITSDFVLGKSAPIVVKNIKDSKNKSKKKIIWKERDDFR